jgi:hypothetical protein
VASQAHLGPSLSILCHFKGKIYCSSFHKQMCLAYLHPTLK